MNTRDEWPAAEEVPQWWREWRQLTPQDIERMREEYERGEIASAQSEQAQEQFKQEYKR